MARLSYRAKKSLPKRSYGLPGRKAYPMPDRRHAADAKARASQMLRRGKLSRREYSKIVRKANRKLSRR